MRKLLFVLVVAALAVAGGLSVDDIINLKKAGFSDAEIEQEIARTKAPTVFDAAGIERLKKAGIGEALLNKLRGSAGEGFSLERLKELARAGEPPEVLIALIGRSKQVKVTPSEILDLSRAGVKPIVLRALRKKPLSRTELLRFSTEGHSDAVLLALLDAVGADFAPDANDAQELARKGVAQAVVARLRGAAGAAPREWRDPASSFVVRYPAGYTLDPKQTAAIQQAGYPWVLAVAVNPDAQAEFSVLGPQGSADDALKLITGFYRSGLNSRFDVKKRNNVELRVGQSRFPAVLASGEVRFADGSERRWEALFVQTDAGLRGILCMASKLTWDTVAPDRNMLFTRFSFKPGGGGTPGGEGVEEGGLPGSDLPGPQVAGGKAWRSGDKTIALRYPESWEPSDVAQFHQGGFTFVSFSAWRRQVGARLLAYSFGPDVRTRDQAVAAIGKVEAAFGGELKVANATETKVGALQGAKLTGTIEIRQGGRLPFEAILVATPRGIRGVLFAAVEKSWPGVAADRNLVMGGVRFGAGQAGRPRGPTPGPGGGGGLPGGDPGLPGNRPQGPTWRLPDGSLQLAYPKSFVPNETTVANVQKSGAAFFRFFAGDNQIGAMLLGLAWTGPRYQNLSDVGKRMAEFHKGLGVTWTQTGGQPIDWTYPDGRKTKAALVTGTDIGSQRRGKWLMLVVPTGDGFRGFMLTVVEQNWEQSKPLREFLVANAKIGPPGGGGGGLPGGDPGGGQAPKLQSWAARDQSFSIRYPTGYTVDPDLAEYQRAGYGWIRFVASDANQRTFVACLAFDPRQAQTFAVAWQHIAAFYQESEEATARLVKQDKISLAGRPGLDATGSISLPNGAVLNWEARFVATPNGIRVVMFAGTPQEWAKLAPVREIVVRGMKIAK